MLATIFYNQHNYPQFPGQWLVNSKVAKYLFTVRTDKSID